MSDNTKTNRVVINSLDDLNRLHAEENYGKSKGRFQMLESLFTRNLGSTDMLSSRTDILRFLLDGPRDVDAECGYPAWLTPDHYRAMYDREGIAQRVVNCEPEESWAMDPEINEDEDETTDTEFEAAWKKMSKKFNFMHYLQRVDVLSGIGQFGILLIGIDDGKDLTEAVEGINDDGTVDEGNEYKLLYLRPFSEEVVFVKVRETDVTSPRYGLPTMYTIHFRDFPNWGVQAGEIIARDVHWSRVIHVADNRKMSEIYGVPRMQPVYNRLYDLRKIYASCGEGYWKNAFPGISFEISPEIADQGVEIDKTTIKAEMESFQNGLQRYLALTGVTAKSMQMQVTDPTGFVECMLKAVAISKAIPYRVLFGSEEAKLAGQQDSRAWNKRLAKRQTKYIDPLLIRPFIDRLIAFGVLPAPAEEDGYVITWPDLNAPTDQDKATTALTRTQALAAYVMGPMSQLIPPDEYLTKIMGMTTAEKDAILEGMDMGGEQEDTDEQEEEGSEGSLTGGSIQSPSTGGNALEQTELSRQDMPNQVDATFVKMPSLNKGERTQRCGVT